MKEKISSIQQHFFQFLSLSFSNNSIQVYTRIITNFFHHIQLSSCSGTVLKSMFVSYILKKSLSQNSTNLYISCFNTFCIYACKYHNCFCETKLKHIKKKHRLPKAIDEAEWIRKLALINTDYSDWIGLRNIALIYLIYGTGMRISEALSIKMVDFNNNFLVVCNTKNKKDRIVYYPKIALEKIQDYRNQCPYPTAKNLWFSKNGKELTRDAATMGIKKYAGVSAHKLRHTFATHMYRNGCNLMVLAEFMGHSSVVTTHIYVLTKPKNLQESIKKYHPFFAKK